MPCVLLVRGAEKVAAWWLCVWQVIVQQLVALGSYHSMTVAFLEEFDI